MAIDAIDSLTDETGALLYLLSSRISYSTSSEGLSNYLHKSSSTADLSAPATDFNGIDSIGPLFIHGPMRMTNNSNLQNFESYFEGLLGQTTTSIDFAGIAAQLTVGIGSQSDAVQFLTDISGELSAVGSILGFADRIAAVQNASSTDYLKVLFVQSVDLLCDAGIQFVEDTGVAIISGIAPPAGLVAEVGVIAANLIYGPKFSADIEAWAGKFFDDYIEHPVDVSSPITAISIGKTGSDSLQSSLEYNVFAGGSGNDTLTAGVGTHNTLIGGIGNDRLIGGPGGNTLLGGAGNDYVQDPGGGPSTIDGGTGDDYLSLNRSYLSSNVALTIQSGISAVQTLPDGTTFKNIEHISLTTGSGDDSVTFIAPLYDGTWNTQSYNDYWNAGGGNNTVTIDLSSDSHSISTGFFNNGSNYSVSDSVGTLLVVASVQNYNITGGLGNDTLVGGPGTNVLDGSDGNDRLIGGPEANTLLGGSGNDYLRDTGTGSSVIDGGAGDDYLDLERPGFNAAVTLTFQPGSSAVETLPDGTTFTNVEHLYLITGSGSDNVTFIAPLYDGTWNTQSYNDYWNAGGGNNTVTIDLSSDSHSISTGFFNNGSNYSVSDSVGTLLVVASVQNYNITGGLGNDTLVGGPGTNVLDGGDGNDRLIGGPEANTLLGGSGNDYLRDTGTGSSVIDGGAGDDYLDLERPGFNAAVTLTFQPGSSAVETLPDGTTFTNVEHLYLITGSGSDNVTFIAPLYDGTWNTQSYNDYWDAGGGNNTVTVNLSNDTDSISASFINSTQYAVIDRNVQLLLLTNVQNYNITGGSGNDTLYGGSGFNTLNGGGGNDTLVAGSGTNALIGGAGNDYIQDTSGGVSTIDGGTGDNYLDLERPNLGLAVTLTFQSGSKAVESLPDGTTFTNIEHLLLITGSGNDSVTFNEPLFDITNSSPFGYNDYWDAGGGNNTVTVNLSNDTDSISASFINSTQYAVTDPSGQLLLLTNVQNYNITGGSGNDTLYGGSGFNTLNGGGGNDTLVAGSGTNALIGGAGNDYIQDTSGGVSTIDGGTGDNYLDLERPNLGLAVTLTFQSGSKAVESLPDGTTFTNIEHLLLITGSGNDSVTFNEPLFDITNSSPFGYNDYWDAGGGNNTVTVNLSNDTDSISASFINSTQYAVTDPSGQLLLLTNVQNYNITGGSGNDTLYGGSGINTLNGGSGNDTLVGGSNVDQINGGTGNDTVIGGGGADVLSGGSGANIFVYNAATDSTSATFDMITDFNTATDTIQLWFGVSAIDGAVTAGSLGTSTFDHDMTLAINRHVLGSHQAVLFTPSAGAYANDTFLVIDANGVAGYQAGQDLVIELQHATNLGSLGLDNFV